jgi:hypothetical protein
MIFFGLLPEFVPIWELERMHGGCTPKARRSEVEIQGFFASLRMTKCMVGQQS